MRILIVSLDLSFASKLRADLKARGDQADIISPGMGAVELGMCGDYDAAFLDDLNADTPALDILERWRREDIALQVILLGATDDWRFVTAGLDAGADQVICRPLQLDYCIAMLRATLRRAAWVA